jgi:serine/threonine-protein kinase
MFSQNVALKTAPTPVGSPASGSGGVDLSPDGRWIAYDSAESGQLEVYVQAHPGPGRRYRVSTDGGMSPVWRGDGRELFYGRRVFAIPGQEATAVEMMAVSVNPQPSLTLGTPSVLFSGPYQMNGPARGYDVTSDGQRFLMIRIPVRAPDVITQLNVVQNWTEELKQGVPPW